MSLFSKIIKSLIALRHSLAIKITLAIVLVSLLSLLLVNVLARTTITLDAFAKISSEIRMHTLRDAIIAFYLENGSLEGLHSFRQLQGDPRLPKGRIRPNGKPINSIMPSRGPRNHGPPPMHGFVNAEGILQTEFAGINVGEKLDNKWIALGVPVMVEGVHLGTIIPIKKSDKPKTDDHIPIPIKAEHKILSSLIVRTLTQTSLLALMLALIVGVLFSRTLTQPLRKLTQTSRLLAKGNNLGQTVAIRGKDEVGELARAFNQMSTDLAEANNRRKQMTADIAHDLRTPLTVMSGYIQALQKGKLEPNTKRFETLFDEIKLLQNLVEDLRLLSLTEEGKLKLVLENTEVEKLLKNVMASFEHTAEQSDIDIRLEIEPNLPAIKVDIERMRQVLGNLISNALRHTPKGGIICLVARRSANDVLPRGKRYW